MNPTKQSWAKSPFLTPIAIIIAGALIAFGLFHKNANTQNAAQGADLINSALTQQPKIEVSPITSADHIRGEKDADVVFIEYSDIECPFCQLYQETMNQAFKDFGEDKKFAWVYRHFPLSFGSSPLHANAAKAAEASECVAELAGEDTFWKFLDEVYKGIDHQKDGLVMSKLADVAVKLGVDKAKYNTCFESGKYTQKIKESYEAGIKAGARGTPHTVIYYKGQYIPLVNQEGKSLGALPYDAISRIIQELLSKK